MTMTLDLADAMLPAVSLSVDEDLIFVSVAQYRLFLAQKSMDAYILFSHLCYTGQLQRTNSVWANRSYLKKGLRWGQGRLDRAMSALESMKLVSAHRTGAKARRFGKTFLQVHRALTPLTNDLQRVNGGNLQSSNDPVTVDGGRSTKCLNEKGKKRIEAQPSASPSPVPKKEKTAHGRMRALYSELYRKNTGASRAPFNAACAGQLRNDLARIGEDQLARCLRWLFAHPPARMGSYAYMSLHTFLPEAEKALASEDRRLSMIRVCGSCGKEQEHTGADCLFCGQPLKGAQRVG